MKIHEYQGKELLRKFGVTVPRGIPCFSVDEAVKAAEELGGSVWVVKAQIHAGNAVYITADLKGIMANMHAGNGVLGKLFMDEGMANTIDQTLVNVKKGTHTLNEDLEALKSNFLFKKGFKKKDDEIRKAAETKIKEAEAAKKAMEKAEKDAQKIIEEKKK